MGLMFSFGTASREEIKAAFPARELVCGVRATAGDGFPAAATHEASFDLLLERNHIGDVLWFDITDCDGVNVGYLSVFGQSNLSGSRAAALGRGQRPAAQAQV
jgi:hypothetical protein